MSNHAKKLADVLHAAAGTPPTKYYTTALIAAAGCSARMGGDTSKQLIEVDGVAVLARTLLAYEAAETIREIVLIARREDFDAFLQLAKDHRITKLRRITEGGSTRQESVRRGLCIVGNKTKFVAIADGARCLITPHGIDSVNRAAYKTGAASAACPAVDSVKIADSSNYVTESPDRTTVWMAQTPQTFSVELYRAAAYYAKENGIEATDDNALVEAIGRSVKLVDCGRENIKITTPTDIAIAHAILTQRQANGGNA